MGTHSLPLVDITGAAVIGEHRLRLLFEDGTVGDVSFLDNDWPGVLAPLSDAATFATVKVAHGTLFWPQFDIDLAPEPLYQAALATPVAPPAVHTAA